MSWRAELVCWVSESLHPYSIVEDQAFKSLMMIGRLASYIPSPSTISHDVKHVFARTWQRIANMLRVSLSHDAGCQKELKHYLPGIWRMTELHNWRLDITEPLSIRGICSPLHTQRGTYEFSIRHCWGAEGEFMSTEIDYKASPELVIVPYR